MDITQHMTEEQRAEAFREFHSQQLQAQTKALETIKALLIVWFVLAVVAGVLYAAAVLAG